MRLAGLMLATAFLAAEDGDTKPDPNAAFGMVRVVDEWGKPIPEAELHVQRFELRAPGSGPGVGRGVPKTNHCDAAGQCRVELPPAVNDGNLTASKAGYYDSWGGHDVVYILEHLVPGPGNPPITLRLMKKLDPVPMVARHIEHLAIPALSVPLGFDLERGAWVAPQGQGVVADLIFTVGKNVVSDTEFSTTVTVTFSNPDDGIMAYLSEIDPALRTTRLDMPRTAPPEGYFPSWSKSAGHHDGMWTGNRSEDGFIFRVRSHRVDQAIDSARYGWIIGDIGIDPGNSNEANGIRLTFAYLLNADPHSISLEWDGTNPVPDGDPQKLRYNP